MTTRNTAGKSSNFKKDFLAVLTKHDVNKDSYEIFIKYFYRWNSLQEMEQQSKSVIDNSKNPKKLEQELTQIFQRFLDYRNTWMKEMEYAGVDQSKIRFTGILKTFAQGDTAVELYCLSEQLDKERELTAPDVEAIRSVIAKNSSEVEKVELRRSAYLEYGSQQDKSDLDLYQHQMLNSNEQRWPGDQTSVEHRQEKCQIHQPPEETQHIIADQSSSQVDIIGEEPEERIAQLRNLVRPYDIMMERIILVLESEISVPDEARAWLLENVPKMTCLEELKSCDGLDENLYHALKKELSDQFEIYLEQRGVDISDEKLLECAATTDYTKTQRRVVGDKEIHDQKIESNHLNSQEKHETTLMDDFSFEIIPLIQFSSDVEHKFSVDKFHLEEQALQELCNLVTGEGSREGPLYFHMPTRGVVNNFERLNSIAARVIGLSGPISSISRNLQSVVGDTSLERFRQDLKTRKKGIYLLRFAREERHFIIFNCENDADFESEPMDSQTVRFLWYMNQLASNAMACVDGKSESRLATRTLAVVDCAANSCHDVLKSQNRSLSATGSLSMIPNSPHESAYAIPPDNDELENLREENVQLREQVADANTAYAGLTERFRQLEYKNEALMQEVNERNDPIGQLFAQEERHSFSLAPTSRDVATNTSESSTSSMCCSSSTSCRHIKQLQEEIKCLRHDILRSGSLLSRKSKMARQSVNSEDSSD
ncbi:uncharacterized protein LOC142351207 [Convolutriloba macropyga]|uniref:uncharacterized protein LOC142351207 n=1 Tax=Convolutriloba macropyga TaxID=536237 RepID=UPI003F51FDC4